MCGFVGKFYSDARFNFPELARRLGWRPLQVDRLFDLRHACRFDQIEVAARALGRRVNVTLSI